jgi:hypothetical protein
MAADITPTSASQGVISTQLARVQNDGPPTTDRSEPAPPPAVIEAAPPPPDRGQRIDITA